MEHQNEPVSKRTRGPTASCGFSVHGKLSECGSMRLCFACGRPGGHDDAAGRWKHVGSGPFWTGFREWCANVGDGWSHPRNLAREPLAAGDCVCCRRDCVYNLYDRSQRRASKEETGTWIPMVPGQRSPWGRYPTTKSQVRSLVENVDITGRVLDSCGAGSDSLCMVLKDHGLHVTTNDLNKGFECDTHFDAGSEDFRRVFSEEATRPDWIVTSPPYSDAFRILVQAMRVAREGVAFKLRLNFLEPTKTRGEWLKNNPPSAVVMLPRAVYRGRQCASPEAWIVWHLGAA
ncbi:unnamed protein product, partial [Hapterophycus canaliculatus]